ncbi:MAG TPA: FHA domain-containing protein [Tepidisphaeraceae bacterium]|nr:FHA domain-containing protein [Tepidisphaeraceae bacterium]
MLKIGSFTFKYKDGPKKGPEERDAGHDADLVVDGADAPLAVAEKVMLIGRRPTCDVSLMEVSVSTAHAIIFGIAGKRYVRDLGSRTGTFVNGQKVHQHELNFGDVVRIGETDLRFEPAGEGAIRPATDDEFDLGGVAVGAAAVGAGAVAADEFVVEDELPAAEAVEQEATYDADLIPVHEDEPTVTPARPVAPPPRAPSRGASREELDELENLVGTAPLDVAAEIAREGRARVPVPEEVAPPARAAEADKDDLIPMSWDEAAPAVPVAKPVAPPRVPPAPQRVAPAVVPQPAPQELADSEISFENDPLNAEIGATGSASGAVDSIDAELDLLGLDFEPDALAAAVNEAAPAAPQAVAASTTEDLIRLDADFNETVGAQDTRALGLELDPEHRARPAPPTVSDQITDAAELSTAASEPQFVSGDTVIEPAITADEMFEVEAGPATVDAAGVVGSAEAADALEVRDTPFDFGGDDALTATADGAEVGGGFEFVAGDGFVATDGSTGLAGGAGEVVPVEVGATWDAGVVEEELAPVEEIEELEALPEAIDVVEESAPVGEAGEPVDAGAAVEDGALEVDEVPSAEALQTEVEPVVESTVEEVGHEDLSPVAETAADAGAATEAFVTSPEIAEDVTDVVEDVMLAPEHAADAISPIEATGAAPEPLVEEPEPIEEVADEGAGEPAAVAEADLPPVVSAVTVEAPPMVAEPLAGDVGHAAVTDERVDASALLDVPEAEWSDEPLELVEESEPVAEAGPADVGEPIEREAVAPVEIAAVADVEQTTVTQAVDSSAGDAVAGAAAPIEASASGEELPPNEESAETGYVGGAIDEVEELEPLPEDASEEVVAEVRAVEVAEPAVPEDGGVPAGDTVAATVANVAPVEPARAPVAEAPADLTGVAGAGAAGADEFDAAGMALAFGDAGAGAGPADADLELIDAIEAEDVMASEQGEAPTAEVETWDEPLELEAIDEDAVGDESAGAPLHAVAPVDVASPVDEANTTVTGEAPVADEDVLPLLELDAAELPGTRRRDPDVLLPLDQVDPDDLDAVLEVEEVVEPTEPTAESALDLEEVTLAEDIEPAGDQGDALSDTAFGQQVAEFTTGASTGEIVEAPAAGSGGAQAAGAAPHSLHSGDEMVDDLPELEAIEEAAADEAPADTTATIGAHDDGPMFDVTAGGVGPVGEPSAVVSDDFGGPAEPVPAPQPAPARGGIGSQSFVGGAVVAAAPAVAPARPTTDVADHVSDQGGFGLGTDLASFIGGMPLVLPELTPPPTPFGQAKVAFGSGADPRAPWQREVRPAFPMGAALAEEVLGASAGLRDVEQMDDEEAAAHAGDETAAPIGAEYLDEEDAALIAGEGAPADEWNIGAVLDEDGEPAALPEALDAADLTDERVAELEADAAAQGEQNEAAAETLTESADDAGGFVGVTTAADVVAEPGDLDAVSVTAAPVDDQGVIESDWSAEPLELLDEPIVGVGEVAEDVAGDAGDGAEFVPVLEEAPADGAAVEEMPAESGPSPEAPAPAWGGGAETGSAAPEWHETPKFEESAVKAEAADLAVEAIADAGIVGEMALLEEVQAEARTLTALGADPAEVAVEEAPAAEGGNGDGLASAEVISDPFGGVPAETEIPAGRPIDPAGGGLSMSGLGLAGAAIAGAGAAASAKPRANRPAGKAGARRGAAAAKRGGGVEAAGDVFGGTVGAGEGAGGLDVFAQTALGPADSVFGQEAVAPAADDRAGRRGGAGGGAGAKTSRGQRAIVPPRLGVLGVGQLATEAEQGTIAPAFGEPAPRAAVAAEPVRRPVYVPVRKRRRAGRFVLLFLLLAALIGGAVLAVLYLVKPQFTVEGTLRFNNLSGLTQFQRDKFVDEQQKRFSSAVVKQNAVYYLASQGIGAGFLERPERRASAKAEFPDDRGDALVIRYTGDDAKDVDRVAALLQAMHVENAAAKDQMLRLDREIKTVRAEIEEYKKLEAEYLQKKQEVDKTPSAEDLRKLEDLAREAEIQYDIASTAAKDAKNELLRLEAQAGAAAPVEPGDDAELAKLQKEMEAAATSLAAAKAQASQEADAKRQALDQAIEAFQQQAAGLAKADPQLAQFVTSVQQLQERTHKLAGDLIGVQQATHQRLSTMKKELDEAVAAQRNEAWAKDDGLNSLQMLLKFAERKLTAVTNPQSDVPPDPQQVKDAQAGVDDLKLKIEARKSEVGVDPVKVKFAGQLEEMIKVTKERLEADRKRIEAEIKEQEAAFARSGVAEKLPEAQRAQAAALKAKQDQINEMRKEYAAALERKTAEANLAVREIEGRIAKLSASADERRRVLAAQGAQTMSQAQAAALAKKRQALAAAEEQAAAARKTYLERNRGLTTAVAQREAVARLRDELESYNNGDRAKREEKAKQDALTLAAKEDERRRIVTPVEPRKGDAREVERRDDRLVYALGASAGVAVLFCLVLLLTGALSGHQVMEPAATEPVADEFAFGRPGYGDPGRVAIEPLETGAPLTDKARRGRTGW